MMFTGRAGPQRRVDLRGKSRQEETREQILERTKVEREKRQRVKLEQKSALAIQARWRQVCSARKYENELRQDWLQTYEHQQDEGEGSRDSVNHMQLLSSPRCMAVLLRFYDASRAEDRARLAAICRAVSDSAGAGTCTLLQDAAAAAMDSTPAAGQAATAAAQSPSEQQMALFRVTKLAAVCLTTLASHSSHMAAVLSSPLAALAASQQPEAALLEFLLKVVNPDSWKASIPSQQQQEQQAAAAAQAGAAAVLAHLYHKQLYSHLRVLLQAVPTGLPGKAAVEVLATQMTVRCITLQLVPTRTAPRSAVAAAGGEVASSAAAELGSSSAAAAETLRHGVSQLLFVPGLWAKCGSLAPVTGRLCTLSLAEVSQQPSSTLLLGALLSSTGPGKANSRWNTAAEAAAGLAAAGSAIRAWLDNFLRAAAAGALLKGVDGEQALAGQTVGVLLQVLETCRHLAVLHRHAVRQQKQQQQQQQQRGRGGPAAQAMAAAAGSQMRRAAGSAFVPGAGFMPGAMELDEEGSSTDDDMDVEESQPPIAAIPNAAGTGVAADSAGAQDMPARPSKTAKQQQPVAASAYSGEQAVQAVHQSGSSCTQLLVGTSQGTQLLRKLVTLLLPAATAEGAAQLQQQLSGKQGRQQDAAAVVPGSIAQQQLCVLLWKLSRPRQYRQRVWLGMSVGVRLVPRLWFSYILPLHLATPGGFLAVGSSSSNSSSSTPASGSSAALVTAPAAAASGGWVQPLLVLVQCYSAALSFTHLEDFYADTAALVPQDQLYSAASPGSGLVLLLKAAVWQVLWCETSSSSPSVSHEQQHQQLLKRSFGELGGLLLCQLHDSNCTRQYCPPEAFLAEALPPGRLLQEVAARGGIDALAGTGDSSDDEADHATPLEQQQQWQRQRQQAVSGVDSMDADAAGANSAGPFVPRGPGRASGTGGAALQGGSESEGEDEDMGSAEGAAADAVVIGPGAAVDRVGGFGFGAHGAVQQRRQQGGVGAVAAAAAAGSSAGSRVWQVLQHAPCLIPFQDRVKLFQAVVSAEKEAAAAAAAAADGGNAFLFDDPLFMMGGGHQESRFVTIRRDQLLQDSFAQLNAMGPDRLKGRLRIAYVNEAGAAEAGIDGGGLFKDFMEELLKKGFSPQSGLFSENPQHQLYPNPAAYQMVPDAEGQLRFLGRMLGKSLYEGMLLELPLAAFFLKKMRGGVCDINDLPSLDPEVYKNLLQLKHYSGDFADLSLTFTATVVDQLPVAAAGAGSSSGGGAALRSREVELKPGGRNIAVRADNVIEYIHRLADFRLNRQMDRAAGAFLTGFFELTKPRWVRMFNEAELQMLISGSEEGIDVDDLVAHVNYAGGYHEEHPVILTLWDAVRTFSPQQQRQFLKFITSCSRAPLLGFAYLEPQLCIQMSGSVLTPDSRERLPTAATCMNLLKLPPYRDFDEMRSKLLYAITAEAGFELS